MHNVISNLVTVCPSQSYAHGSQDLTSTKQGVNVSCSRQNRTATRPGLEPGTRSLPMRQSAPFDEIIGFSQTKLSKRSFVDTRAQAHDFNYFLLSFIHILVLYLVQSFGYIYNIVVYDIHPYFETEATQHLNSYRSF